MSSRASKSASAFGPYGAGESYDHEELWPGERIGTPLPRRGSKALLRGIFLLIVLGGGWALLNYRPALPDWASIETTVSAWINRNGAGPVERANLAMATASPPAHLVPPTKPLNTPLPSPPQAASSSATAAPSAVEKSALVSSPPAAAQPDEAQAGPLPPPAANPADPYRIRAEAVGLHPDLSRVLLDRLSPTDYRNAGIAIKTALAETPDSAVFVFPRQRKPELALFRVHFVPGAAPGCRRYVVAITKDGWLTTALPMEKCGPQTKRARRD